MALVQVKQDNDEREVKQEHRLTQYRLESAITKATQSTTGAHT